jgi:hypothetical protein
VSGPACAEAGRRSVTHNLEWPSRQDQWPARLAGWKTASRIGQNFVPLGYWGNAFTRSTTAFTIAGPSLGACDPSA